MCMRQYFPVAKPDQDARRSVAAKSAGIAQHQLTSAQAVEWRTMRRHPLRCRVVVRIDAGRLGSLFCHEPGSGRRGGKVGGWESGRGR